MQWAPSKARGGLALAGLLLLALPALAAPGVRFSGVLGQSQPPGAEPLPFIGANGAIVEAKDLRGTTPLVWTAAGTTLYGFDPTAAGVPAVAAKIPLPAPVGSLAPRYDGSRLFYFGDGRLYAVELRSGHATPLGETHFSDKIRAFALAPGSYRSRKIFVLEGDTVTAYGPQGEPRGAVLTLSRPAKADWWYAAVGIEPSSGDLLVGSYYPDSKIYRFDKDGREVTSGGWPRPGQAASLDIANGLPWVVRYGSGAFPLPPKQERGDVSLEVGGEWMQYVNGVAADPKGGYWLAGSEGLTKYDTRGRSAGVRLGGIDGVRSLALADDGTVIAAVENGQRMIRLGLDDDPSTPLRCCANEPWRVAAGWTARAAGLAFDGQLFAVADEVNGQLWSFDPWHTAWGEKPWIKLSEPKTLSKPRAVAVADQHLWVLDGGKVVESARPDLSHLQPLPIPDVSSAVALAAIDDDHLAIALPDRVRAFARAADGTWRQAWEAAGFSNVTALAADGAHVVLSAGHATVTVLTAADGRTAATIGAGDVVGGWQPGVLAVRGPWLVVAEAAGRRLLRFRLVD
jgi:hypothetical protein